MNDGPVHTIELLGGATPDPAHQHIYAVRLHPYRSLSQRNFRLLLCIFSAISFATTIPLRDHGRVAGRRLHGH